MGTGAYFDDRNVLGLLQTGMTEYFENSWATQLSLFNGNSDRAVETYGILGANPAMREWIGERQLQVLDKKSYEIRNKPYEATIAVPQTELNRDKLGMLQVRLNTFAQDANAAHWESLITALILANGLGYDGHAFFDTDHSWGSSTQLNLLGASQIPSSNVSTTTAPTVTEMANTLLEMTAYMLAYKNNQGRPVNGGARKFVVMTATAQMYSAAVQAVSNNLLASYVTNPLTGMKEGGFSYSVMLNPDLTGHTETIELFRVDGPVRPFIMQEEQGLEINMLGRGSDYYFKNKAISIGVDASRGVGYGAWEYASRVVFT